ncbi:MAG: hypothetical protein ACI84C_000405 [Flavobacteriales bacterium]|jgi:hypothetical protein
MKKLTFVVAAGLILLAVSCKKDKETEYSIYSSQDNSRAEDLFNDVFKVVDEVASDTEGIRGGMAASCIDNIVIDTTSTPMSILIDFGDDDCESDDGRVRKGSILVTFTGRYREEGTVIVYEPNGYSVNGYIVDGTKTVTNLGENAIGNIEFAIEIEDGEITAPDNGYTMSWEASRIREWVEGDNSWFLIDDAYEITGSSVGVNRNGIPYTTQITSPLRAEIVCPYLTSGVMEIVPEGRETRVIDFGGGDCNNTVTVTVGGQTFSIAL